MKLRTASSGVRSVLQKFFRRNRSPISTASTRSAPAAVTDGVLPIAEEEEEPEVIYTFKDHMDLQQYSEASQLLIDRENQLFLNTDEPQPLPDGNSDVETLENQRQELESAILNTIRLSLNRAEITSQALTSAVSALGQEEAQDDFWLRQKQAHKKPKWRPAKLGDKHDQKIKEMVEERMDNPDVQCSSPEAAGKGSYIQNDVWGMGRQMKQDLETVADVVKGCYSREQPICDFYALLFHREFERRMRRIAEFGLDDNDNNFILRWVKEYYPQFLERLNLSKHIDTNALGTLLPPSLLQPLEDQYMSKQKMDITVFMEQVLNDAKQMWTNGENPNEEDGCFVSETAFDIIQLVNGSVKTAETILTDPTRAQSLTSQLPQHLQRYKAFLEEVIKSNKSNSVPTVKANLHCIQQFNDVLITKSHLFPEDVRASSLSTLGEMQRSAQTYLLTPVHAELKPVYRKLGTDWLKGAHFKKLLEHIESKNQEKLQGLAAASHQELMGQFHLDVCVEFVKRLIRGDKLKDSKKQQEAHDSLQRDAEELQLFFNKMGSREEWLKDVLIRIAELLKLQDLAAVQMHVASMGTSYPDLSEKHVSSILKLKSNFTKANIQTVKETLRDTLRESAAAAATEKTFTFFSLVPV